MADHRLLGGMARPFCAPWQVGRLVTRKQTPIRTRPQHDGAKFFSTRHFLAMLTSLTILTFRLLPGAPVAPDVEQPLQPLQSPTLLAAALAPFEEDLGGAEPAEAPSSNTPLI